jgi:hypothetical protein
LEFEPVTPAQAGIQYASSYHFNIDFTEYWIVRPKCAIAHMADDDSEADDDDSEDGVA